MKPRKIDKFTPAPPGMKKVHVDYYMAYPRPAPGKKKAAKKAAKKKAPSKKNVTVRKKKADPFDIDYGKNKGF